MNAVNAVLLFVLVGTFTVVCQADEGGCSVTCDDVTGTVGEKVTFTCSVPQQCDECNIIKYKIQYPESYNDSITSNQELPKSFTCSFIPNTEIKEKFKFFAQTQCGTSSPEFSVNIAEPSLIKAKESEDTETEDTESRNAESKDAGSKDAGSKAAVITPLVGLFVIIMLIIILMAIIWKKQSFGFQKRMFLCIKHDDNITCPESAV